MSIRQFSGRFFFRDRTVQLKIGGPVSDDGQQTVIAIEEETAKVRVIRCDLEAYTFQKLAHMVRDQFAQISPSTPAADQPHPRVHH